MDQFNLFFSKAEKCVDATTHDAMRLIVQTLKDECGNEFVVTGKGPSLGTISLSVPKDGKVTKIFNLDHEGRIWLYLKAVEEQFGAEARAFYDTMRAIMLGKNFIHETIRRAGDHQPLSAVGAPTSSCARSPTSVSPPKKISRAVSP